MYFILTHVLPNTQQSLVKFYYYCINAQQMKSHMKDTGRKVCEQIVYECMSPSLPSAH